MGVSRVEQGHISCVRGPAGPLRPGGRLTFSVAAALLLFTLPPSPATAATVAEAEELFRTGKYAECAAMAAEEIERGNWLEEWRVLKIQSELAQGAYPQALKSAVDARDTHPASLRLQLLTRTAYLHNDNQIQADVTLAQIERFVVAAPRRYVAPADRVALGRFLLIRGADPRQVLELMFDPVRKDSPEFVEVYFATAELALDKLDNALAAQTLRAAPEAAAKDPRFHYLLARAHAPDDPVRAEESLQAAQKINPRHVDSLLMRVDRLIDAEQYSLAERELAKVLEVNSAHPLAWSYKAVAAHIVGDAEGEKKARQQALSSWSTNPEVDHLIGRKLSQKYRFAEGAAYQWAALKMDATYRPAKLQLSQDLLRLGEETEGWRLADEVLEKDAYNVVAFNLNTLRKEIAKFRTLKSDGFIVRMESREADLYGDRVLDLLARAKDTLCEKYDVELRQPIVVEIFPRQQDFAVRTFGMPGADGFLGVCFGRVITANSPASQGEHPSNWEAVLWHEFCHVVTLHKTHNKMPRWLSEGISVYEERQANVGWGQSMSPKYREMIVTNEMPPVSQLSSAFLAPKTPMHLQFAYYQSALVVEFLVERFGIEPLKKILSDLGDGMDINEALIRHTMPLGELDDEFAKYAGRRAEDLAPGGQWDEVDLPPTADAAAIAAWLEDHPKNVLALRRLARRLITEKKYAEALRAAEKLQQLYPDDIEPENAYSIMALAHHELGNSAGERRALEELATRNADVTDAHLRLIELGEELKDWQCVADNARRLLAVNPLIVAPHRSLAKAAEALGERDEAIRSYQALLTFDTADPALTHFRLATLLKVSGQQAKAKRHVLMALDEAPRYREAHRLLLELTKENADTESVKQAHEPPANKKAAR
jgi:tetratricopeptide (TPR) repeat protein